MQNGTESMDMATSSTVIVSSDLFPQSIAELTDALDALERVGQYEQFNKKFQTLLQLLLTAAQLRMDGVVVLVSRAQRVWVQKLQELRDELDQKRGADDTVSNDAEEDVLLSELVAARKRCGNSSLPEKMKKSKPTESTGNEESRMDVSEVGDADCMQREELADYRMGPYKMPKRGRLALAAEKAFIEQIRNHLNVVADVVVPDGQKILLPPLNRSRRSLYKPPTFGRVLYESARANPAARKPNLRNKENPYPPLTMHCSLCRGPLGAASEGTPDDRVPYIVCTTPDCERTYHKRCVAALHECFFPDAENADSAQVDLMNPSTFIFVCPRCVFCHDPNCKVAAEKMGVSGSGAYSLKEPGPGDSDAYSWPSYRRCEDCEAPFHMTCSEKFHVCAYCHGTLRNVKAMVGEPVPPGGACAAAASEGVPNSAVASQSTCIDE